MQLRAADPAKRFSRDQTGLWLGSFYYFQATNEGVLTKKYFSAQIDRLTLQNITEQSVCVCPSKSVLASLKPHSGEKSRQESVPASGEDKNSAPSSSTAPPASPMSARRPTTLKTVRCSRLHFLAVLQQKGQRKKTDPPPAF